MTVTAIKARYFFVAFLKQGVSVSSAIWKYSNSKSSFVEWFSTHCVTAVAIFVLNFSFARFKVLKLKMRLSLLLCQSLSGAHGFIGFSVNIASNYIDLQVVFDHFFTICNCWKSFLKISICRVTISKRRLRCSYSVKVTWSEFSFHLIF
jgi:hypothetical protein